MITQDPVMTDTQRLAYLLDHLVEVPYRGGFHDDGGYWRIGVTFDRSDRDPGPKPSPDACVAKIDAAIAKGAR